MVREIFGKLAVIIYVFMRRLTKLQTLKIKNKLLTVFTGVLAKSFLIIFLPGKNITHQFPGKKGEEKIAGWVLGSMAQILAVKCIL